MSPTPPALNEALAASATQLLDFIRKTAENAEGFVVDQAPLFIQEYLQFNFYQDVAFGIILFLILILNILGVFKLYFWCKALKSSEIHDGHIVCSILGFCIMISLIVVCGTHCLGYTIEAIKIKVAPRVYIVDTLLNKVK